MSTTPKKTAAKKPAKKAAAKKPASRSGNPATRAPAEAAAQQASDISAFKSRRKGVPLRLPSDLVVYAKRVELQTLIKKGNVPNPLMEVVGESLKKGQQADIAKMVGVDEGDIDLDMVADMYDMVNRVVIESVTQPRIWPEPEDEDDRDDELLYVEDIDPEDKMFIYQWACGGTSDIAQFRDEARADMDALAEIQGSAAKAK